jgi:hypothetical protein
MACCSAREAPPRTPDMHGLWVPGSKIPQAGVAQYFVACRISSRSRPDVQKVETVPFLPRISSRSIAQVPLVDIYRESRGSPLAEADGKIAHWWRHEGHSYLTKSGLR